MIKLFLFCSIVNLGCNVYKVLKIKSLFGKESVVQKDFKKDFEFSLHNDLIVIKAKINDNTQEFEFLLDTGALTLLSKELVEQLKIKTIDISPDKIHSLAFDIESSALKASFLKLKKVEIGGIIFKNICAMVLDYSKMGMLSCLAKDGIIGANLMKNCVWQINYKDTTISITDNIKSLKHIDDAQKISFYTTTIQETPHFKSLLNGNIEIDFIFDTGHNGFITISSNLLMSNVEELGFLDIVKGKTVPALTIQGKGITKKTTYVYLVKPKELQLGENNLKDIPLLLEHGEVKRGLIGNEFLKNYIITLDWQDKIIYLSPIQELPTNMESFGLSWDFEESRLRVGVVWENTLPDSLGIEVGDEIVSINDKDVNNFTQEEICEFYRGKLKLVPDELDEIEIKILKHGDISKFHLRSINLLRE